MKLVDFEAELDQYLPADLPHRATVIVKASQHLRLIVETNKFLNLTRIATPREAAIKHVLDSVMPWRLFSGAKHVLDAGTGAGFPGIPLALVLPEIQFTLAESIGKKARFVASATAQLNLPNVNIAATRAEQIARDGSIQIITARALAPVARTLDLFGPALRSSRRMLLYKGPDAAREIEGTKARIVMRYELPESLGTRTIVEIGGK
jgi:16S rRNA (guanine527-N7)-methyltransferase